MARKKPKRRPRDEDDDLLDEDEGAAPLPRSSGPRNDAYVGMLAISFVSLLLAAVLLYADFDALSQQQVSPPAFTIPPLGAVAATP